MISTLEFLWQIDEKEERKVNNLELSVSCQDIKSEDFNVNFVRARIGNFDVDLFREFFQGFVNQAQITLHIDNLKGINAHHQIETVFKAFGRALRQAITVDTQQDDIVPSTKGVL